MQPDEHGNYTSPPLNALRLVWKDYQAGVATADNLGNTLQAVSDFAQFQLDSLGAQVERGESNPDDPVFRMVREGFEHHLVAVDQMFLELEEPAQGHYEIGLKLAQQATNQLALGHQLMVEHIEAMGRVCCMFCGRENDRGQAKCNQCGRALPQDTPTSSFTARESEGLEPASKGQVTENYKQLAAATEAWRAEELEADGLLARIEEVEDRLTRHQGDNLKYRETLEGCPEEHRAALYKAVDATDKALDAGLLALEKMKLAFEKEDDSYLESGLHDFEASSWMMLAALSTMQAAVAKAETG